jgi:uncharacterized protein YaiI (UPF0178 family)
MGALGSLPSGVDRYKWRSPALPVSVPRPGHGPLNGYFRGAMLTLYIDADACPVKDEAYKVAKRHGWPVIVVANAAMRIPADPAIRLQVVSDGFDAADDWIVESAGPGDIVITSDIPLADRSLKRGAFVLGNTGRPFTEENIGDAMASREIAQEMREMGLMRGGPAPFQNKDRSEFLMQLDRAIHALKRKHKQA